MNQKLKGIKFEREIVNKAKSQGKYASRSSASLGVFDVITIDKLTKQIELIQCKSGKPLKPGEVRRIYEDGKKLEGIYEVTFKLIEKEVKGI